MIFLILIKSQRNEIHEHSSRELETACLKRLYDIANFLETLGLIQKVGLHFEVYVDCHKYKSRQDNNQSFHPFCCCLPVVVFCTHVGFD